jgi:hypothetical protein
LILTEQSRFRRIRADLHPHQASFIDGIRFSIETLDVAYSRLCGCLDRISRMPNAGDSGVSTAIALLDAWAVIDAVHRLRELLNQMPGLKKNSPTLQLFIRNTEDASEFRNTIQHLRGELKEMSERGWPAWGSLTWLFVADPTTRIVHSCLMIPGRVQSGAQNIINPLDHVITNTIDVVTLHCKDRKLSLTALYRQTEKIVRALEPGLAAHIENESTHAADLLVRMEMELANGVSSPLASTVTPPAS